MRSKYKHFYLTEIRRVDRVEHRPVHLVQSVGGGDGEVLDLPVVVGVGVVGVTLGNTCKLI